MLGFPGGVIGFISLQHVPKGLTPERALQSPHRVQMMEEAQANERLWRDQLRRSRAASWSRLTFTFPHWVLDQSTRRSVSGVRCASSMCQFFLASAIIVYVLIEVTGQWALRQFERQRKNNTDRDDGR